MEKEADKQEPSHTYKCTQVHRAARKLSTSASVVGPWAALDVNRMATPSQGHFYVVETFMPNNDHVHKGMNAAITCTCTTTLKGKTASCSFSTVSSSQDWIKHGI